MFSSLIVCHLIVVERVENETKMVRLQISQQMKEQSVTAFDVSNDSRQDKLCHCNTIYILLPTHPLICPLYTHLSLVAYLMFRMRTIKERTCVLLISFPPKKLSFVMQLFSNNKECHYQLFLVTISFHKQKGLLQNKKLLWRV